MNLEKTLIFFCPDDFTSGGFENVDTDEDKDTTKIYSDLINNSISVGIKPRKVNHDDYKPLGIFDFGPLYPPRFK